jgi:hypothetical protein
MLLASLVGRFAHRDCVTERAQAAASDRHGPAHSRHSHAPQHQHEAPSECAMVGSCATIAAVGALQVFNPSNNLVLAHVQGVHHDYRDPHLTLLKPPPRAAA